MPSRRVGREQALQALYSVASRQPRARRCADGNRRRRAGTGAPRVRERTRLRHARLRGRSRPYRRPAARRLDDRTFAHDRSFAPAHGRFELRKHPETPPAVVINEAVELAKTFLDRRFRPVRQRRLNAVRMQKRSGHAQETGWERAALLRGIGCRDAARRALRRGHHRRHRRRLLAKSAGHQPDGRLSAGELDAHLRTRRLAARLGI